MFQKLLPQLLLAAMPRGQRLQGCPVCPGCGAEGRAVQSVPAAVRKAELPVRPWRGCPAVLLCFHCCVVLLGTS